jgi:SHS2 domain-containing protein
MGYYKQLDHAADVGIMVWGDGMKSLFINSARAMYDMITDIRAIKPVVSFHVQATGMDMEELLKNWLSELLYYFHTKDILLVDFDIKDISGNNIVSSVSGEGIDRKRHILKREIKAVTYHNLKIAKKGNRFQTDIIFDI